MRVYLIYIIFLGFSTSSFAQWLTQSGDGKGTILFKGSTVTFNATTSELSFSLNNLNDPVKLSSEKDNHFFFYGANLNAKSAEGLANIFSTGDLIPEAKLNGYIGVRLSNSFDETKDRFARDIAKQLKEINKRQGSEFRDKMQPLVNSVIDNSALDNQSQIDLLKKTLADGLVGKSSRQFFKFLNTVNTNNNADVQTIINTLKDKTKAIADANVEETSNLTSLQAQAFEDYKKQSLSSFYIFLFGGIDALSFKRLDTIPQVKLSKRFITENFRGGQAGIGINFQRNRWKIGATIAYHETNNFSLLDKTEYKLTTTTSNTATNETLVQEKSISGYSGTYGLVRAGELNLDITYNFNLNKTFSNYAIVNPYFRNTFSSSRPDLLPDNYTFGLGVYFFKKTSKFLGGLYVELPDVEDAFEKIKPTDDQNIRAAIKRFTFGVVTKFSLGSVLGAQ